MKRQQKKNEHQTDLNPSRSFLQTTKPKPNSSTPSLVTKNLQQELQNRSTKQENTLLGLKKLQRFLHSKIGIINSNLFEKIKHITKCEQRDKHSKIKMLNLFLKAKLSGAFRELRAKTRQFKQNQKKVLNLSCIFKNIIKNKLNFSFKKLMHNNFQHLKKVKNFNDGVSSVASRSESLRFSNNTNPNRLKTSYNDKNNDEHNFFFKQEEQNRLMILSVEAREALIKMQRFDRYIYAQESQKNLKLPIQKELRRLEKIKNGNKSMRNTYYDNQISITCLYNHIKTVYELNRQLKQIPKLIAQKQVLQRRIIQLNIQNKKQLKQIKSGKNIENPLIKIYENQVKQNQKFLQFLTFTLKQPNYEKCIKLLQNQLKKHQKEKKQVLEIILQQLGSNKSHKLFDVGDDIIKVNIKRIVLQNNDLQKSSKNIQNLINEFYQKKQQCEEESKQKYDLLLAIGSYIKMLYNQLRTTKIQQKQLCKTVQLKEQQLQNLRRRGFNKRQNDNLNKVEKIQNQNLQEKINYLTKQLESEGKKLKELQKKLVQLEKEKQNNKNLIAEQTNFISLWEKNLQKVIENYQNSNNWGIDILKQKRLATVNKNKDKTSNLSLLILNVLDQLMKKNNESQRLNQQLKKAKISDEKSKQKIKQLDQKLKNTNNQIQILKQIKQSDLRIIEQHNKSIENYNKTIKQYEDIMIKQRQNINYLQYEIQKGTLAYNDMKIQIEEKLQQQRQSSLKYKKLYKQQQQKNVEVAKKYNIQKSKNEQYINELKLSNQNLQKVEQQKNVLIDQINNLIKICNIIDNMINVQKKNNNVSENFNLFSKEQIFGSIKKNSIIQSVTNTIQYLTSFINQLSTELKIIKQTETKIQSQQQQEIKQYVQFNDGLFKIVIDWENLPASQQINKIKDTLQEINTKLIINQEQDTKWNSLYKQHVEIQTKFLNIIEKLHEQQNKLRQEIRIKNEYIQQIQKQLNKFKKRSIKKKYESEQEGKQYLQDNIYSSCHEKQIKVKQQKQQKKEISQKNDKQRKEKKKQKKQVDIEVGKDKNIDKYKKQEKEKRRNSKSQEKNQNKQIIEEKKQKKQSVKKQKIKQIQEQRQKKIKKQEKDKKKENIQEQQNRKKKVKDSKESQSELEKQKKKRKYEIENKNRQIEKLEKVIEELKNRYNQKEKQVEELRNNNTEFIILKNKEIQELKISITRSKDHESEIKQLKDLIEDMKNRYNQQIYIKEKQVEELRNNNTEFIILKNKEIQELKISITRSKDHESEIKQLKDLIEDMRNRYNQKEKQVEELRNNNTEFIILKNKEIQELKISITRSKDHESEIKQLKDLIEDMKNRYNQKEKQVEELRNNNTEFIILKNKEIQELKISITRSKDHESEIKQLKDLIEDMKNRYNQKEKQVEELRNNNTEFIILKNKEIQELKISITRSKDHESEIKQLKDLIEDMRNRYNQQIYIKEKQVEELRNNNTEFIILKNKEIQELKISITRSKDHESEIKQLKDLIEDMRNRYNQQIYIKEKQVEELRNNNTQFIILKNKEIQELKISITRSKDHESEIKQLKDLIEDMKNRYNQKEKQVEELRNNNTEFIILKNKEIQELKISITRSKDHESEIKQLKDLIEDMRNRYNQQIYIKEKQIEELRNNNTEFIILKNKEIQELKISITRSKDHESEIKQLKDLIEDMRNRYNQQIYIKEKQIEELRNNNTEFIILKNKEIQELKISITRSKDHESEIKQLKDLIEDMKNRYNQQIYIKEKQVEELRNNNTEFIILKNKEIQELKISITRSKDHESEIKQLKDLIEDMKNRYNQKEKQVEELRNNNTEFIILKNKEIQELKISITRSKDHESEIKQLKDLIEDMRNRYNQQIYIKEKQIEELRNNNTEFIILKNKEIQELKISITRSKDHESEIKQLKDLIEDMRNRYNQQIYIKEKQVEELRNNNTEFIILKNKEIQELKISITRSKDHESEIKQLKDLIEDMKNRYNQKEKQVEELRNNNTEFIILKNKEIQELKISITRSKDHESEIKQLKDLIEDMKNRYNQKEKQVEELRNNNTEFIILKNKEIQELKISITRSKDHESEIKQLKDLIEDMRNRYNQQIYIKEKQIEELRNNNTEFIILKNKEIQELKISITRSKDHESEIKQLKDLIEDMKNRYNQKEKQVEELRNNNTEFIILKNKEIQELKISITRSKDHESEIKQLKDLIEDMRNRYNQQIYIKEKQIEELRNNNTEFIILKNKEIQELKISITRSKDHESEIKQLKDLIEDMRNRYNQQIYIKEKQVEELRNNNTEFIILKNKEIQELKISITRSKDHESENKQLKDLIEDMRNNFQHQFAQLTSFYQLKLLQSSSQINNLQSLHSKCLLNQQSLHRQLNILKIQYNQSILNFNKLLEQNNFLKSSSSSKSITSEKKIFINSFQKQRTEDLVNRTIIQLQNQIAFYKQPPKSPRSSIGNQWDVRLLKIQLTKSLQITKNHYLRIIQLQKVIQKLKEQNQKYCNSVEHLNQNIEILKTQIKNIKEFRPNTQVPQNGQQNSSANLIIRLQNQLLQNNNASIKKIQQLQRLNFQLNRTLKSNQSYIQQLKQKMNEITQKHTILQNKSGLFQQQLINKELEMSKLAKQYKSICGQKQQIINNLKQKQQMYMKNMEDIKKSNNQKLQQIRKQNQLSLIKQKQINSNIVARLKQKQILLNNINMDLLRQKNNKTQLQQSIKNITSSLNQKHQKTLKIQFQYKSTIQTITNLTKQNENLKKIINNQEIQNKNLIQQIEKFRDQSKLQQIIQQLSNANTFLNNRIIQLEKIIQNNVKIYQEQQMIMQNIIQQNQKKYQQENVRQNLQKSNIFNELTIVKKQLNQFKTLYNDVKRKQQQISTPVIKQYQQYKITQNQKYQMLEKKNIQQQKSYLLQISNLQNEIKNLNVKNKSILEQRSSRIVTLETQLTNINEILKQKDILYTKLKQQLNRLKQINQNLQKINQNYKKEKQLQESKPEIFKTPNVKEKDKQRYFHEQFSSSDKYLLRIEGQYIKQELLEQIQRNNKKIRQKIELLQTQNKSEKKQEIMFLRNKLQESEKQKNEILLKLKKNNHEIQNQNINISENFNRVIDRIIQFVNSSEMLYQKKQKIKIDNKNFIYPTYRNNIKKYFEEVQIFLKSFITKLLNTKSELIVDKANELMQLKQKMGQFFNQQIHQYEPSQRWNYSNNSNKSRIKKNRQSEQNQHYLSENSKRAWLIAIEHLFKLYLKIKNPQVLQQIQNLLNVNYYEQNHSPVSDYQYE